MCERALLWVQLYQRVCVPNSLDIYVTTSQISVQSVETLVLQ